MPGTALTAHEREIEEERAKAAHAAEDERLFSAAMIESMPGIVYFYDETGRFLRWNRNFEIVSGYSADELATMQPVDFFAEEERELIAARIGEVFSKGASWAEASLVAKDGAKTPYYFTGRRVSFQGKPCFVGMGIDVSDRKRNEAEAARAKSTVDEILESVTDAFVAVDRDWRYTYANERAARLLGRPRDGLIGKDFWSELPESVGPALRDAYERAMRERVAIQLAEYYPQYDAWLENRIYPSNDGIAIVLHDVTARKRSEKTLLDAKADLEAKVRERTAALDEAMRFLDAIIDHLPDAVFYKDASLRFLGANRAYERAFGVSRDSMLGKTVLGLDYLPEIDRERYQREQVDLLASGTNIRREAEMPFADGRVHQTLYSVTGIRHADGSPAGAVGTIVDITPLKETEAALARAMKAAEAADRTKSAFLATMSHELRTPLNSIIGFTGILLQGLAGPLNEEQTKQLAMVRGSARHLLDLINDVLDISKIEAGQMTVHAEPVDLRERLERAVATVKPMADRKKIALRMHVAPSLPPVVSDARRIEQIVLNLLNNAVKFTERGEVTLEAAAVEGDPRRVRLRVIDTGNGIREEDQALLFQPFQQIDTGLTRKYEGTGLGLAICKRLAMLLGGDITLSSAVGRGSTFTVTLPTEPAAPDPA